MHAGFEHGVPDGGPVEIRDVDDGRNRRRRGLDARFFGRRRSVADARRRHLGQFAGELAEVSDLAHLAGGPDARFGSSVGTVNAAVVKPRLVGVHVGVRHRSPAAEA